MYGYAGPPRQRHFVEHWSGWFESADAARARFSAPGHASANSAADGAVSTSTPSASRSPSPVRARHAAAASSGAQGPAVHDLAPSGRSGSTGAAQLPLEGGPLASAVSAVLMGTLQPPLFSGPEAQGPTAQAVAQATRGSGAGTAATLAGAVAEAAGRAGGSEHGVKRLGRSEWGRAAAAEGGLASEAKGRSDSALSAAGVAGASARRASASPADEPPRSRQARGSTSSSSSSSSSSSIGSSSIGSSSPVSRALPVLPVSGEGAAGVLGGRGDVLAGGQHGRPAGPLGEAAELVEPHTALPARHPDRDHPLRGQGSGRQQGLAPSGSPRSLPQLGHGVKEPSAGVGSPKDPQGLPECWWQAVRLQHDGGRAARGHAPAAMQEGHVAQLAMYSTPSAAWETQALSNTALPVPITLSHWGTTPALTEPSIQAGSSLRYRAGAAAATGVTGAAGERSVLHLRAGPVGEAHVATAAALSAAARQQRRSQIGAAGAAPQGEERTGRVASMPCLQSLFMPSLFMPTLV